MGRRDRGDRATPRIRLARRRARSNRGPVRLLVGEDDDVEGFRHRAERLRDALAAHVEADVIAVPGVAHTFADEPGTDPAPPSPATVVLDRHAVDWPSRYLRAHDTI